MVLEGEGEKGEAKADSQFSRAGQSSPFPFSENNMPGNNKTQFQLELPVKYAVYMVVTRYWLPGLFALPSPLGWTWRIEHLCASLCACACVCLQLCVHTCAFVCVGGGKLAHDVGPPAQSLHTILLFLSQLHFPCACSPLNTLSRRPSPRTPLMFCHLLPLLLSPISLEPSTKYLNFTASEKTRHVMEHQYQVGSGEGAWGGKPG